MTEETKARHDAAEDERARAHSQRRATDRERERILRAVREVIQPVVHPFSTTHARGTGASETDRITIEITRGAWMRLHVLYGAVDGAYYRALPEDARPSEPFLAELELLQRGL